MRADICYASAVHNDYLIRILYRRNSCAIINFVVPGISSANALRIKASVLYQLRSSSRRRMSILGFLSNALAMQSLAFVRSDTLVPGLCSICYRICRRKSYNKIVRLEPVLHTLSSSSSLASGIAPPQVLSLYRTGEKNIFLQHHRDLVTQKYQDRNLFTFRPPTYT